MTKKQRGDPPAPGGVLADTGERMIPAAPGEISFTYARHAFAYGYAAAWVDGKSVLDVGCGTGYGARLLADRARAVTALDQSEEAIAYCRTHYAAPNIDFRIARAEDLNFPARFDAGVCFQVIEHLPDPAGFLTRLRLAIAPGGLILMTTPNVRAGHTPRDENPFHLQEMTFDGLSTLLTSSFSSFRLLGIAPSKAPLWRQALRHLPLYRWGSGVSRTNPLKKMANRTLDLTHFRVIEEGVASEAIDLLAVCINE
jgi:2-polyprenyl-3-methyl-5-hydroxy-6-metoxy-1,4-benzoquinol methylase